MDTKKVLLVEDEPDLGEVTKYELERAGFDVRIVSDGKGALDAVKASRPDIVVLDIMLPKISGYEVCRILKFDPAYKDLKIILFSARAAEYDKELGQQVGADAYLVKSSDIVVLVRKINDLLG